MLFDHLKSHSPSSLVLIRYLAFMNPNEIVVDFLKAATHDVAPDLHAIMSSTFNWAVSLNGLEIFSLVGISGDGAKLKIHRLVQEIVRDSIDRDQRNGLLSNVIQLGLSVFPDTYSRNITDINDCRRLRFQIVT